MFAINEQFSKFSSNGFENILRVAQISLDNSERLIKYQFEQSKQALEDNVKIAQELSGLTDAQQVLGHINKVFGQSFEKAVQNSREVYDILAQASNALSALTESNLETMNKTVAGSLDAFSQSAPAGSGVALDAFKNSLSVITATLNTLGEATRQAVEPAEDNVKTTTRSSASAKSGTRRNTQTQA